MKDGEKLVAIEGGGDWADASVDYLVIPGGMDVKAERVAYDASERRGSRGKYETLADRLIVLGARLAGEEDVIVLYD